MITVLVNDDNISDLDYVAFRTDATFTSNEDTTAGDMMNMFRIAMLTDTYAETSIYKGMIDNIIEYVGVEWIRNYLHDEYNYSLEQIKEN